ncbi:MAG: tripartite tricarboxylate transporter substrate binding protein [Xanthobacteraceae bacterium]
MTRIAALCLFALLAASPVAAAAQNYPSHPVRIIVGYPAGGGVDYTARLFATRLQAAFGQPAIVENRPGAGGEIAAEYVAHAEPDGYTLFYAVGSDLEWTKFLTRRRTIDPLKELTPIASVISSVNCAAVNAAHPLRSFADLVAFAKRNPGKLTYGTAGTQSYYYLIGLALKQQGVDMLHVPYKGNAPVVSALLGRQVDVALTTLGSVAPLAKTGAIRILAVMEPKRFAAAPEIPAMNEVLPDFRAPLSWFGFFGPAGLPQPIVDQLGAEIGKAARSPDIDQKVRKLDLNVFSTGPHEIRPLIADSTETFQRLIVAMDIKPAD